MVRTKIIRRRSDESAISGGSGPNSEYQVIHARGPAPLAATGKTDPRMMADDLCPGFEPQVWKKERCKRCFRLLDQHGGSRKVVAPKYSSNDESNGSGVVRRTSWRDRVYGPNGDEASTKKKTTPSLTNSTNSTAPSSISSAVLSSPSPSSSSSSANDTKGVITIPVSVTSNDSEDKDVEETFTLQVQKESSPRRKTRTMIINAEVSVDDTPPEQVLLTTQIKSDSPESTRPSTRSTSPDPEGEEVSFRSARSGNGDSFSGSISKSQSFESLATTMDTKSMVTAISGSDKGSDDNRSSTPTDNLDKDSQAFIRSIKAQLEIMEGKCAKLEVENGMLKGSELSLNKSIVGGSDSSPSQVLLTELQEKLTLAEGMCQDYRDENTVLKCELRELQEAVSHGSNKEEKKLKDKLQSTEGLCEEMIDENEQLKREVQELQHEIEELQDQYREEEIEEFRDLQRELEQTAKNCRVLQFKLRKSERTKDQAEADRQHFEERVNEMMGAAGVPQDLVDSRRVRELESELRIAKEVSVRLHNELEALEEKRCKMEDEKFYLKERVRELETREKLMEASRQKYEQMHKKTTSGSSKNASRDFEYNVPQLLRDMQDALERETDMRDQLKFAEDDLENDRKKLMDLETENEGLLKQLAKFTTPSGSRNRPPMKRSASEGQTQIQLELAEHEATVIKDKLNKSERDNEKLICKNSLLEKELKRCGGRTEFTDSEIHASAPDTYYKQKIKMLEEEVEELKAKLETSLKAEADQDLSSFLTWPSRRKERKDAIRSRSLEEKDHSPTGYTDLKKQLAVNEQQASVLRQQVSDLEAEVESVKDEKKRLEWDMKKPAEIRRKTSSGSLSGADKMEQMQADIDRFIARISELEKDKEALADEIERRKKLEQMKANQTPSTVSTKFNPRTAPVQELREKAQDLLKDNASLTSNFRQEQDKCGELEKQLTQYKQVISQSENQRLVSMATKVEVLNNQLKDTQERFQAMHQRLTNSNNNSAPKYEDVLKEQIQKLETELAEERAKALLFKPKEIKKNASPKPSKKNADMQAELSECLEILTEVESQADKAYEQLEELESAHKSPRGGSPRLRTPTSSAEKEQLVKEVAQVKVQLDTIKSTLKKKPSKGDRLSRPKSASDSTQMQQLQKEVGSLRTKCNTQDKSLSDLREQLDLTKQERECSRQECVTATERLLQTEERWNKELEKLKESYLSQVKDLKYYLNEAERSRDDKVAALNETNASLTEKTKKIADLEAKVSRLENDLKGKHKDLQDKLESEKKKAKDFETKHQKLEELYEGDRNKLTTEREKFKSDLSEMKKKYDDTQTDFNKLKQTFEKKQKLWLKEKDELDGQIKLMQSAINDAEREASKKAIDMASAETRKLMNEVAQLRRKGDCDVDEWRREKSNINNQLEQKQKDIDFRLEEIDRMKKEMNVFQSRIDDQKMQLEETRKVRDDAREELSRWQQTWTRERSELAHKLRQEGKIQQAEQQALHLKYESRIKVMEESSKRFQTQLTQTRRERDQYRDSISGLEKKLSDLRLKLDGEDKETKLKLAKLDKISEERDDFKLQLEKEQIENKNLLKNSETDRRLWHIEKEQFTNKINEYEKGKPTYTHRGKGVEKKKIEGSEEGRLQESMKIATELRAQVEDMKTSYEKELHSLKKLLDKNRVEINKERSEKERKLRELQETVKVLEIDKRNMLSLKDETEIERSGVQAERDTLLQRMHDTEIHQLANKYKLDKVADQLNDMQARVRYTESAGLDKRDICDIIKKAMEQLMTVRDDMGRTRELGKALETLDAQGDQSSVASWKSSIGNRSKDSIDIDSMEKEVTRGERLAPIGSEQESASKSFTSSSHTTNSRSVYDSNTSRAQDSSSTSNSRPSYESASLGRGGYMPYNKSRSLSTENAWESRIAEIRLRSPSPSPRKLTNYPEAPPNMVLRRDRSVEYDKNGVRHWTPSNSIKRSISLDPCGHSTIDDTAYLPDSDAASQSSNTQSLDPRNVANGEGVSTGRLTPSSLASSSPNHSSTLRSSDLLYTNNKSNDSSVKNRRGIFSTKKSRSVDNTNTGAQIGNAGIQMIPPAVASPIPSDGYKTKRTSSATRLFDKLRRSTGKLDKQDSTESCDTGPIDTGSSSSRGAYSSVTSSSLSPITSSTATSKSTGNVRKISVSPTPRYSTVQARDPVLRRFQNYGGVRSLSTKYLRW